MGSGRQFAQWEGMELMNTLWLEMRYAVRSVVKDRSFSIVAMLTLALGIGVNSAVFSVVYGVLLRPLPYPDPDRLVRLCDGVTLDDVTLPEFQFWRDNASSFESAAAHGNSSDQLLQTGARNEWAKVLPVTPGFFETLAVPLALGAGQAGSGASGIRSEGVILTHPVWTNLFAASPAVIGQQITAGSKTYTIAGVAPKGFWFPEPADIFVPLEWEKGAARGANTKAIARLKRGVSIDQASAEMPGLQASYGRQDSRQEDRKRSLNVIAYQRWLAGDVRTSILLLFGAVSTLLLIACANLVSLLLARVTSRRKEFALRIALGGTWPLLFRQYLLENLILCLAGSLLGLLGAWWFLDAMLAMVPFDFPGSGRIALNATVGVFTLGLGVLLALVLSTSLLPAASLRGPDALRLGGRTTGPGLARQRARGLLVAGETGFSLMLLVAAALLIQSLFWLTREQLGFSAEQVLTFRTPPPNGWYRDGAERQQFEAAMLERLKAIPGVRAAAAVNVLPLQEQNNFPAEPASRADLNIGGTEIRLVTPEYFDTLRISIKRGRAFTGEDRAGSQPVALINETLARRWWPNGTAVGERVAVGRFRGEDLGGIREPVREVVGVASDTKAVYLKEPPRPTIYLPAAQVAWMNGGMYWVVRAGRPEKLGSQIRSAARSVDPAQQVERLRPMDDIVSSVSAGPRFYAWLFGCFGALALLLTGLGVYGLITYSVSQRTSEIGTRMALGATGHDIARLILKDGVSSAGAGLAIGLVGAVFAARSLASMLYGVRSTDMASFVGGCLLLLGAGVAASYFPARRAVRVDPATALRNE